MGKSDFLRDRFNITTGLNALIHSLPDHVQSHVIGACAYVPVRKDGLQITPIANAHGAESDINHQTFLNTKILNKRINVAGTSIAETRKMGNAVAGSGFRNDHTCINVIGDELEPVIQLVLSDKIKAQPKLGGVDRSIASSKMERFLDETGLQQRVFDFNKEYKGRYDSFMDLGPVQSRDGFLMYCDVKGSSALADAYGFQNIYDYLLHVRSEVIDIAKNHGGYVQKTAGDGVWINFPCTGVEDKERMEFFAGRVIPAAEKIAQWHKDWVSGLDEKRARQSFMKVAVSHGVYLPFMENSRYYDYTHDGEPFFRTADMMEKVLKQMDLKKDTLIVDETTLPHTKVIAQKLKSVEMAKLKGVQDLVVQNLWTRDL